MSADFWAGYISGAVGIIIGNPLDILKVRLQATSSPSPLPSPPTTLPLPTAFPLHPPPSPSLLTTLRPFLTGTAAPVLGYGALNALLFVSYNRSTTLLNSFLFPSPPSSPTPPNLTTPFLAGCLGGLATFFVSTPTELIKCRAQLSSTPISSWSIAKDIFLTSGIRGLYFGGTVTALRDSIGYGFYFWSYELSSQIFAPTPTPGTEEGGWGNAARVLLCGGIAGIVTWASIFPLDVVKTRVQGQVFRKGGAGGEGEALLDVGREKNVKGAWAVARETFAEGGIRPFFRGLGVCSVRAFIVNAVQWTVYEWIMRELGEGRGMRKEGVEVFG